MNIKREVLALNSFKSFNPLQKKALKKDIFSKNVVVSAPTASGKTIIAELCALNTIINKKKKVIYTCPLKALASEHFNEFKKKYSKPLNVRVALSTGDLDSSSKHLANYDLVFATNEKVDSLIRHRANWLSSVGLLVVDEVHELDSDRGATLEMVISKLLSIVPSIQLLALSATIPNAKEIAEWMKAELIESSFRPVELREGVLLDSVLHFKKSEEKLPKKSTPLEAVVIDTIGKKKQALFFANTRRNAEALAVKIAELSAKHLTEKEKEKLELVSKKVLAALESPTEQCKRLASLVKKGTAFHHAGLLQRQRVLVEENFKKGLIKFIAATPTLAAGVNLPSFRVVIPSLYRFTEFGMKRIPVREYKQWVGRAGRPKYDQRGESILFARNEIEGAELRDAFINGSIEPVESRLSFEPVLRMHLLALIASRFVFDNASLEGFFSRTFYSSQYLDISELVERIEGLIGELIEFGFVEEKNGKFFPTKIGQRVSDLYLDPVSAHSMIKALSIKLTEFGVLYCLVNTVEFSPWISVSRKKESDLWQQMLLREKELPIELQREQFFDEAILSKFQSALLLEDWINEKSESEIMEQYNVQPGILFNKTQICDWLAYSMIELAKLLNEENIPLIAKLRRRLKYGVREELLQLTELRGIGRVRARRLYRARIKTLSDLKRVSLHELAEILGKELAIKVKTQLGQNITESEKSSVKKRRFGQGILCGFN